MGLYINQLSNGDPLTPFGKAESLITDGAKEIPQPSNFVENLVCVVDNGIFEAAGYCFSPAEFMAFVRPDGRSKRWLIHPKAKELAK